MKDSKYLEIFLTSKVELALACNAVEYGEIWRNDKGSMETVVHSYLRI